MFNPDSFSSTLPVTEVLKDVKQQLAQQNTLIVTAPPGAGKSTLLPLALLNEPWLEGRKIVMLEPRRLAASSIARRMASMLSEPVGHTVGYRIRFENKTSKSTRIEVVTEGILTRMLQTDNALEEVGMVIFDEFHERSIHADVALALSREVQQVLRPELRLLIMSATLDVPGLAQMLNAPVLESKGRAYPVEIIYTGQPDGTQLPEECSRTVVKALREQDGDCLVFLPGQAEIRRTAELLKWQLGDFAIHSLYGALSQVEQEAALLPDPQGRRKVVLATSIAETSLTIEGVKIVVDSGFTRKSVFDNRTGLSGLKTVSVSLDSADQRAGRAGRLGPGICYRMWSLATQERLAPYRTPEILESDLSTLVLDLLEWGIQDAGSLSWLNPPPAASLQNARELLLALGALEGNRLTPHGKEIQRLPTHPRLANMLLFAENSGKLALATDIAGLLEERDPLDRSYGADLNIRVEHLRRYRSSQRRDRVWDRIEKTAAAYRRLFRIEASNAFAEAYDTGLLLAYAYPERVASAKEGNTGQFMLANGQTAHIPREDDLSHESWLTIPQLDAQMGRGKVFIAAPLNPAALRHLAKEAQHVRWDSRKGQLLASTDLRLGNIVLQSKPSALPEGEALAEILAKVVEEEGASLLNFNEETENWQARVLSLRQWNPNQGWPDVSIAALLKSNASWLAPYYPQIRKADDFRRIDLPRVLHHSLDYQLQSSLDRLAPASITVPSGSRIKLAYSPYGEAPVLAVRLQELFGMLDTPRVNEGRQPVVLHLLSPGYKPVQVTTDLRSFWQNTYFEVRKELKRRYPKHSWPENPLEAEAVRGVRKKV